MLYFSADFHCYHTNIIKHCNRPFNNASEMVDCILDNHNSIVKPNDDFYFLGDFAWQLSYGKLSKLVNKFNGRKHFFVGNHDHAAYFYRLEQDNIISSCNIACGIKVEDNYIWLSHYAHRSWNKAFQGAFHLYGHSHSKLPPYGLSFDVGVDCWDFKPISYDQVVLVMKKLDEKADKPTGEVSRLWNGVEFIRG